jgi:hypothetical protein
MKRLLLFSFVLFVMVFSSCEKNDVDESGMARLKVVNASPNAGAQNFYLVNSSLINTGLEFSQASDYLSTHSGNRLVASFRDKNTNVEYANGELWMADGDSYTVYLAGQGSKARVKQYEDDLSAPSAGKAKVKFIHLSDGAPSDIRIKDGSGDNLVTNLSRNIESGYKNIAPGTLSLSIYSTSTGNLVGNFSLSSFVEGKVYAVFITGDQSSNIQVYKVDY